MLLKRLKPFVLIISVLFRHQTYRGPKTHWRYRLEWFTNPLVTLTDRDIVY